MSLERETTEIKYQTMLISFSYDHFIVTNGYYYHSRIRTMFIDGKWQKTE